MLPVVKTPFCSIACGQLADGCKSCVKGEKLVIFVTGLCPATCFYCPISDERKMKDVMFANETALIGSEEEQLALMIDEAKKSMSTGAGITGGDPLARLDRTCNYIRALKKEFGKQFHIHLYTPLVLVNKRTLDALYDAGLDEIRFHPSLTSQKFWHHMQLARTYPWRIGIEIPVFPDKVEQSEQLIRYAMQHHLIDFINLNELEIAERTADEFAKRGYGIMDPSSHAVMGSREAGALLLCVASEQGLPAHFCTSRLKDRIQMGNRLIRRAVSVSLPFDTVDEEGLLTRGAIYFSCPPESAYAKQLDAMTPVQRKKEYEKLARVLNWLHEQGMPKDAGTVDESRLRLLLSADALRAMAKRIVKKFPAARCAVVREYPTSDAFLVELAWV